MEIKIFKTMKEAIAEQISLTKKGHKAKGRVTHDEKNTPVYKVEDYGPQKPPSK